MNEPTIQNYGCYAGSNYGAHTIRVTVGPVTVWFSYRTPILFFVDGNTAVARRNVWGPTTGKHLRWATDDCGILGVKEVDPTTFWLLWDERVGPFFGPREAVTAAEPPIPDKPGRVVFNAEGQWRIVASDN